MDIALMILVPIAETTLAKAELISAMNPGIRIYSVSDYLWCGLEASGFKACTNGGTVQHMHIKSTN
jgi:hypothetical protein